jgi:SAM-dependent methyltransferase
MSYFLVQGQHGMTLDKWRNQAYAAALAQVITAESVVLDVGAGLGIHGLLAAQLGAKRVYLVEPEDIIAVAEEIARHNGYADRIQCLQGKIEAIDLPEPVDVIVSVFTGNFLLEEDLLPSLFYARDKHLKPTGVLIPQAGVMEAVPVSVPNLYQKEIEIWSQPHFELDYTPARRYASQAIYYYRNELAQATYLAEPASLFSLDFYQATSTDCHTTATYTVHTSGLCHGWVGWFTMQLQNQWLSTAPHAPPVHWSAAFLPLDPPIAVTAGETITFTLHRPAWGDWSWRVETANTQQQRSTFLAVPLTLSTVQKQALDYQPQLNDQGNAALYVLSHQDGKRSVRELSQQIMQDYPHLFAVPKQAIDFVQGLIYRFS